jgi:hypothetical protein
VARSKGERPNHNANDHYARTSSRNEGLPGLSLKGEEGKKVVLNAARLAIGSVSLAELGDPRYGLSPDFTPRVRVDEETFLALSRDS